jgi:hypothetical protein
VHSKNEDAEIRFFHADASGHIEPALSFIVLLAFTDTLKGQLDTDASARIGLRNFEDAAEQANAFAHSPDPDAHFMGVRTVQFANPAALVPHLKPDQSLPGTQPHPRFSAAGVPVDGHVNECHWQGSWANFTALRFPESTENSASPGHSTNTLRPGPTGCL